AAEQFGGGEGAALGLEDAALLDPAALADAAVGGHQQRLRIGIGYPRPWLERAGEEGVEGGIGARIGFGGLVEVHAEAPHHGIDQPAARARGVGIGQCPRERGQQPVRQHPGQGGDQAHRGRAAPRVRKSAAIAAGSSTALPVTTPAMRPRGSSTAIEALWSIEYWSAGAPSAGGTLANTIVSERVNASRVGMSAVAARVSRWKA